MVSLVEMELLAKFMKDKKLDMKLSLQSRLSVSAVVARQAHKQTACVQTTSKDLALAIGIA